MVAEEGGPLALLGNSRGLLEDVDDREPVLHLQRHEEPRHDREVEGHVALVAFAEVGDGILGPLIRLGEQHPPRILLVHPAAQFPQKGVRFREILAVGALALVEVGHGVEPETVHSHPEPEVQRGEGRLVNRRILEIQVRLVGVEPVPVVGAGIRIPGPVGALEVLEDDPRVGVAVDRIAPDVEIPRPGARPGPPGPLKPRVLVRRVVQHQLGDDAKPPPVRFAQESPEVLEGPVRRVDVGVVRDIVAVVLERRRIEGQQPDRGDPEILEVVQLLGQSLEISDPVAIAVAEGTHVHLVDDRVPVPLALVAQPVVPLSGPPARQSQPARQDRSARSAADRTNASAHRSGGPRPRRVSRLPPRGGRAVRAARLRPVRSDWC